MIPMASGRNGAGHLVRCYLKHGVFKVVIDTNFGEHLNTETTNAQEANQVFMRLIDQPYDYNNMVDDSVPQTIIKVEVV